MVRVVYFSTKNRISPFVGMIGEWPDRAAMVKTVRNGTTIGWRKAVESEIELLNRSTRHVALAWDTLRDMLWTHRKNPELAKFYPGLIAAIRKRRWKIRQNLLIVEKKKAEKKKRVAADRATIAANRAREEPPSK